MLASKWRNWFYISYIHCLKYYQQIFSVLEKSIRKGAKTFYRKLYLTDFRKS